MNVFESFCSIKSCPIGYTGRKRKSMLKITFEYADNLSGWEWKKQSCIVSSVNEFIKIYGLGVDCKYRIIEVKEV